VKHRLKGQPPKEAVDHTIIDFGLIELHRKLKKLKNANMSLLDRFKNKFGGLISNEIDKANNEIELGLK